MQNQNTPLSDLPIIPVEPKKSFNLKFWVPIIVVVIIVAGYLIIASQSNFWPFRNQSSITAPEGNSEWKTYHDNQFGIELQYPSSFTSHVSLKKVESEGTVLTGGAQIFTTSKECSNNLYVNPSNDNMYNNRPIPVECYEYTFDTQSLKLKVVDPNKEFVSSQMVANMQAEKITSVDIPIQGQSVITVQFNKDNL